METRKGPVVSKRAKRHEHWRRHFKNLEGRLPDNKWREADLNYKGGHRSGKRLIFSRDGERFVTVDHYKTFMEVVACQ